MSTAPRIDRLWTVDDVSEYLGVPVKTLYQWRTHGEGPKGGRVGRYLRYDPDDVVAWWKSRKSTAGL